MGAQVIAKEVGSIKSCDDATVWVWSPLECAELAPLRQVWRRDEERSAIGFELDRSGIYGGSIVMSDADRARTAALRHGPASPHKF